MKVRMLVGLSGPAFNLAPGDEYPDCDPAEAIRLVKAGYAVPIDGVAIETAIKPVAREKRKAK